MRDTERELMVEEMKHHWLAEELRKIGFEFVMAHPDKTWRVIIWAKTTYGPSTLQSAIILPSKRDVIEFFKGVLLGYKVGIGEIPLKNK